eukprot:UN03900
MTLSIFCTTKQRNLSRLSVIAKANNICDYYIPGLYLQGIVTDIKDIDIDITLLKKELYLGPTVSTLIIMIGDFINVTDKDDNAYFRIQQTAMPHKYAYAQSHLLMKEVGAMLSMLPKKNIQLKYKYVTPIFSPMIATIIFGVFNIPNELKLTSLEAQFKILLYKASEVLAYIEHHYKELLCFYDQTSFVYSSLHMQDEQIPMEALYPQIMERF